MGESTLMNVSEAAVPTVTTPLFVVEDLHVSVDEADTRRESAAQ